MGKKAVIGKIAAFFVPILNIYAMFFCLPFEKTAYINV